MGGSQLLAAATGGADHQRYPGLPAEHAVDLRGVVDDLVERQQREVDRHDFDDRTQAQHRGTDRGAREALLGDGGVAHAALAELGEHPGGDLVGALEDADLLADEQDVLVAQHLGAQGVMEGLPVGHEAHAGTPIRGRGAGSNSGWPGSRRESLGTAVA